MTKNGSGQKLTVFAWDSTTGLPKTGDAANLTAYVSKNDGTVTSLADTSATEQSATLAPGYYVFDLAQSETNADKLMFSAVSSTDDVVVLAVPSVVYTVPANFTKQVIDSAGLVDATAVKIGPSGSGTAQTAKDLGALNVSNVNTLASHDPGETIMGATDLGTGAALTSLASASALSTLQGNVTTLLARVIALAVTTGTVASGTASATAFPTDLTEATDGHWSDAFVVFTSGDLAGQVKRITDYDGTSKTMTVAGGFTGTPSEGDAFAIVNR